MVALYLAAIVLANLTVAWFGPAMTIANAFIFIALDMTSRDALHDAWHGKGLVWKMALLIASGSLLSWAINREAGAIALASLVAFACAAVADTVTYHALREREWWQRANGSNIVSAAVDSIIFPTLAFGALLPAIVIGQFVAKVMGGAAWSMVLSPRKASGTAAQ